MSRMCFAIAVVCILAVEPSRGLAGEKVDFAREVQPILRKNCAKCHGADEQNGSLRLDERATLFAEADSGAAPVVAGEPGKSELIRRILSTDEADRMPPEGKRLTVAEIELLTRWVAEGAQWADIDPSATPVLSRSERRQTAVKTDHWSFQPLTKPRPPAVNDETWPRNVIDRFVQARRESAGLKVAPDAEPEVLIRRASYSLTGLPPTPEEVAEFVAKYRGADAAPLADQSATPLAELVDRLLSRPAYGERWGRHWMDWVRYADTAGDNSDFPIPQAYLYRNYIIDSFNNDLPYDRFLIEQIAGDLLPAENQEQQNRQTIATGYLAMSRRFGSLVERYPWHLTVEDTIDNMGRTMLGLSISCARCHDHKFDPISARDYYGIYGFFASTRYPFPGIELFQTQKDFVPLVPAAEAAQALAPFQETTDKLTSKVEGLLAECEKQSLENAAKAGTATLEEQRKLKDELAGMLIKARRAGEELAKHLKTIPELPTAYAVQDREPRNARIQIKGEPDRPGAEVPRKFLDVLGGQQLPDDVADETSGRLQLARWIASPDNPLTARVVVNRIWQRHFGSGLVSTPSDFGVRGEPPTHPELLDWLAGELINSGWSIKHLHRLIMSSRTYQLSSWDVAENLVIDPGNRWYWKFNRQRLDAESLRDTLLLVAGSLDTAMPREPHPFPASKNWEYTQHHPFKDEYTSNKRSVYLMTRRLTARPYFQTFDGPDPNACTSSRDQSVTALQALYFVNDKFLHQQASRFAERLLREDNDAEQRLSRAFHTVLCRPPSSQETTLLQEHLAAVRAHAAGDSDAELQAWSSLCRGLLRLNEFLYVD